MGSVFLRTMAFAEPARRISMRERNPSEFTRRRTVFSLYFIPLLTHAPLADATNWPSLHQLTRTPELLDSTNNWYMPYGSCAPSTVTGVGRKKKRAGFFLAEIGKLATNQSVAVKTIILSFILPLPLWPTAFNQPRAMFRFSLSAEPRPDSNWSATKLDRDPNWFAANLD